MITSPVQQARRAWFLAYGDLIKKPLADVAFEMGITLKKVQALIGLHKRIESHMLALNAGELNVFLKATTAFKKRFPSLPYPTLTDARYDGKFAPGTQPVTKESRQLGKKLGGKKRRKTKAKA